VSNELGRFQLVQGVIDRLPQLGSRAATQAIRNALIEQRHYINEHGRTIRDLKGPGKKCEEV
jgi:xylulose-5-phosphate/fructose-6-phosphate phosphoketolase